MKKSFIFLALLMATMFVSSAYAADYIVPITMSKVSTNTFQGVGPGDRLLISAGNRGPLTIEGLRGEPGNPIIVINSGGIVSIDATWVGITLNNCKHIKLTGSGAVGIPYGFLISNGTNMGVRVADMTDEVEIEYVEITNVEIGISAQTVRDINDNPVGREWTQYNTNIHHCYLHDISHEGMYIGGSYYNKGESPNLVGVHIYDNILLNIGFDGIQISAATEDVDVHNNRIENVGFSEEGRPPAGANGQDGIIIGPGSVGSYHHNTIKNAGQDGILCLGRGPIEVYSNDISNVGLGNFGGNGITLLTCPNEFIIKGNNVNLSNNYGIFTGKLTNGKIFENILSSITLKAIVAQSLPEENIYNNSIDSLIDQQVQDNSTTTISPPANLRISQ